MEVKLKSFFEGIGLIYKGELERAVANQTDLNGNRFSLVKPSTAKARASVLGATKVRSNRHSGVYFNRGIDPIKGNKRKSFAKSVPLTRLLFTKKFWQGAFKYKAEEGSVRVYVSGAMYPSHFTKEAVSYADIVRFNNKGGASLNPRIDNPPLIFPKTNEEIAMMKATTKAQNAWNSQANNDEILRQMTLGTEKKTTVMMNL